VNVLEKNRTAGWNSKRGAACREYRRMNRVSIDAERLVR
jgi:hypothetical protein